MKKIKYICPISQKYSTAFELFSENKMNVKFSKAAFICLLCIMIIIFAVPVFAGDVPEGLLMEDNAKVFLGTAADYPTDDIPYNLTDSAQVIPTKKIKGDVVIGVKQIYSGCHSPLRFDLIPGVEYLFGYLDENNFYIYEIESREDTQFKLVDSDKDDMTKRLEEYLNNGSFEKAENERLAKIALTAQADNTVVPVAGSADEPAYTAAHSDNAIWAIVCAAAAVFVVFFIKRKNKNH